MISSLLLEAALRSVLLAAAVWAGLRIFGVKNVLAQKAAWGLVLVSALSMPFLLPLSAHWSVLPANVRVTIPGDPQTLLEELQARIKTAPEPKPLSEAAITPVAAPVPERQGDVLVTGSSEERAAVSAEQDSHPADQASYHSSEPLPQSPAAMQAPVAEQSPVVPRISAASILKGMLWLYAAVAGVLLLRLMCGLAAALRLLYLAEPVSLDADLDAEILDSRSAKLRSSARVASPVTICSSIVLPAGYAEWDAAKLRVVVAHERSHIRQGDFYLQLLAEIYAAVVWFSPLGWWLKRKLSDLAEAISDRAGLEQAADRTSYAQILLEFAAAPRPTPIGVAMARTGSLSRRIERLLNDASFRQAFAGTRRGLAALALVPVALFAATALVRVEAASQQAPDKPPVVEPSVPTPAPDPIVTPQAPQEGVSTPEQPQIPSPVIAPTHTVTAPADVHVPEINVQVPERNVHVPPVHVDMPARDIHIPAMNQMPEKNVHVPAVHVQVPARDVHIPAINVHVPQVDVKVAHLVPPFAWTGQDTHGYSYHFSDNGDSYAVIRGGDPKHMTFSGNWVEGRRAEIDKATQQAGGKDFLWFTHAGKSYIVDDPATVAQIEAMYKPMEDLGRQQEELGKKQEALGKQQEELGHQQEKASVPTPDMSKQIAEIEQAMAKLKASQGKMMTQDQFADLQEKLGDLQGRLGEIQGEIGSKQGEFGARMGELGSKMGALGAQMGELGAKQGKIAQEADQKVKSIIDQSLKNGKARPVQ